MLSRQKVIVSILREARGSTSRVQLMKWSFLLATETPSSGGNAYYQFVPYLHGPHSFSLYQEIDALVRDGVIENRNEDFKWRLTDVAEKAALSLPATVRTDLHYIMNKYGSMNGRQLIDMIYEKYPWYTINSQDVDKRREKRPVADIAVYTIGYEALSVDDFLNRLLKNGIQCLVDVRNNPISRRFGFHKSTLSRLCEFLQIEYFHFPELGIPSSERELLVVKDDYEKLFVNYRKEVLASQSKTVKNVASIFKACPSVLVCMEANPAYCHRTSLAHALAPVADLPIKHLEWPR